MSDWGNAFDEQCRSEALEVPEKTEKLQSNSDMDQNEENKGFGGVGRGGMFGGGLKMNAPPPQTSFGATSGTRVGGSFGNPGGPDGRGAAIGSSEELNGGGNIISVGYRKEKSACDFTRGGGFGTNRSTAPSAPTIIKTNHEGGRFGVLSPRSFNSNESADQPKVNGGRFGASQASISRTSVGGAFGSKSSNPSQSTPTPAFSFSTTKTENSAPSKSFGGGLGPSSKPPAGGSFGSAAKPQTSSKNGRKLRILLKPPGTTGGGFGSSTKSATTVGGGFGSSNRAPTTTEASSGSSLKPPTTAGGSFGSTKYQSMTGSGAYGANPSVPVIDSTTELKTVDDVKQPAERTGGGFGANPLSDNAPKPSVGGAFGASKSSSKPSVGGAFGKKPTAILPPMNVPPPTYMNGKIENDATAQLQVSHQDKENNSEPRSMGNSSFGSRVPEVMEERKAIECSVGRQPSQDANSPQFGRPAPVFFKSSNEEENQVAPQIKENEKSESMSSAIEANPSRPIEGSFGRKSTMPDSTPTGMEPTEKESPNAPFMSGPPPAMRGGFQGGFRGGRGGGQMDFGGPGQGRKYQTSRGNNVKWDEAEVNRTHLSYLNKEQDLHNLQLDSKQLNRLVFEIYSQRNNSNLIQDPKYKYTKSTDTDPHEKVPVPADIALLNKFIQKEVKMMKDTVVDVQRQDPKSPLYSISSFRELRLKPEVLQALDSLNFQFPTRIQETALPLLLMEPPSNLIAQAQSGTGKTAAFVLTMLCRIDINLKCPQCICLAPTLELAKQIGEVVEKMGRYMENLKIHYAIKGGNMAAMRGRKLTEQIVIGTPGITRDYLQKYKCIDPSQIRCLVLDEADVMIYHQGFTDISTTIYNMVEEASDSVQSMLFSATYDEPVINFATKIIKNAIVVMLKREEQALPNIKQFFVQCACRDSKYAAIVNLYSGLAVASSVIFCHTKASVMWLYENMKARGHKVDVLHGDMSVVERADTIIRFKRGDFKVLITTNVFARGIDVAQVSVVINYDLPIKYNEHDSPMVIDGFTQPDCETYLHRIGRTGRFGKTGIAINLIDSEDSMNMINVLENHFQMKIARMDPSNIVELEAIEMA
ncbi:Protein CBG03203 [Caenorhabditis briggsae]|uniref:RNA helicase n=1 Tax=Caenorhabditis briggsae TaxID=6238 RepID=A8WSK0_CAEBR|nr:Protein CBG03203 [Caenorhabditis briggsae]CAP23459.2 Protein CBG03203 [Caenorhabditis briggsae]